MMARAEEGAGAHGPGGVHGRARALVTLHLIVLPRGRTGQWVGRHWVLRPVPPGRAFPMQRDLHRQAQGVGSVHTATPRQYQPGDGAATGSRFKRIPLFLLPTQPGPASAQSPLYLHAGTGAPHPPGSLLQKASPPGPSTNLLSLSCLPEHKTLKRL